MWARAALAALLTSCPFGVAAGQRIAVPVWFHDVLPVTLSNNFENVSVKNVSLQDFWLVSGELNKATCFFSLPSGGITSSGLHPV